MKNFLARFGLCFPTTDYALHKIKATCVALSRTSYLIRNTSGFVDAVNAHCTNRLSKTYTLDAVYVMRDKMILESPEYPCVAFFSAGEVKFVKVNYREDIRPGD